MRTGTALRNSAILLLIVLLGPAFSQGHARIQDRFIIPEQRIAVSKAGKGTWTGRDIAIDYQFTSNKAGMTISGTVNFADSIRGNYSWIRFFHLDLIFADGQGRVLGTRTFSSGRRDNFDPTTFSNRVPVPKGAAFFSFSYRGEVIGSSGHGGRQSQEATYIWTYPVTEAPAQNSPK